MQQSVLKSQQCHAFKATRLPIRPAARVIVRAVAEAEAPPKAETRKKVAPLKSGGTLSGDAAFGKDAGDKVREVLGQAPVSRTYLQLVDGKFKDSRWINGRWDLSQFAGKDGTPDWDMVIDAEMARRKLLEDSPIPSTNEDPVNFDTSEIPWWAWVKRFHLPEAEKLNGRAAMMGYFLAMVVDKLSGASLLEQQGSFLGLVALHITVFGILLVRSMADLDNYKNLIDEATFYDRQWNATWEGVTRPSEKQQQ